MDRQTDNVFFVTNEIGLFVLVRIEHDAQCCRMIQHRSILSPLHVIASIKGTISMHIANVNIGIWKSAL